MGKCSDKGFFFYWLLLVQVKANPMCSDWLPEIRREGKIGLSCQSGITRLAPKEPI